MRTTMRCKWRKVLGGVLGLVTTVFFVLLLNSEHEDPWKQPYLVTFLFFALLTRIAISVPRNKLCETCQNKWTDML